MTRVLLDTDIGTDIDDTWALAMLLNCPEIDLAAVVTTHGDVGYRAALAARILEIAGRTDVAVGAGVGSGTLERCRFEIGRLRLVIGVRIDHPEAPSRSRRKSRKPSKSCHAYATETSRPF